MGVNLCVDFYCHPIIVLDVVWASTSVLTSIAGGIIDITDHGHLQGHHSSSSLSPRGVPDAIQPHAILCEDGGYLINPSSISTSPIRSFTQLQDLDPDQRACYQNQFQAKARRSRGQKSVMSQSKGRWPNQFDELLGTAGYIKCTDTHTHAHI